MVNVCPLIFTALISLKVAKEPETPKLSAMIVVPVLPVI